MQEGNSSFHLPNTYRLIQPNILALVIDVGYQLMFNIQTWDRSLATVWNGQ